MPSVVEYREYCVSSEALDAPLTRAGLMLANVVM